MQNLGKQQICIMWQKHFELFLNKSIKLKQLTIGSYMDVEAKQLKLDQEFEDGETKLKIKPIRDHFQENCCNPNNLVATHLFFETHYSCKLFTLHSEEKNPKSIKVGLCVKVQPHLDCCSHQCCLHYRLPEASVSSA